MATRNLSFVGLVTLSIGVSVVFKSTSTSFIELIVAVAPDGTRFKRTPSDTCDLCQMNWIFLMNFKGPQNAEQLRTLLGPRAAPIEAELVVGKFSQIRVHPRGQPGGPFGRKPMDDSNFLCKLQSLVAAAVSSVTSEDVQSRIFIVTDERHVSRSVSRRYRRPKIGAIEAIKTLFPCAKFLDEQRLRALDLDDTMSNSSATTHTRSQKEIARNSQTCACDARRRLLVLGTGRSGSTTITNMLNQVPGLYISGETKLFHYLYSAMRSMSSTLTFRNPPFLCAVRDLLDVSFGDFNKAEYPIFGVKEVGFVFQEMLELVRSVYPCAKFVINTRANLTEQAQSGHLKSHEERVQSNDAIMKSFENVSKFDLELGTNYDATNFTKLLRWAGVQGCFYKSLMHSNDGGYSPGNMSRTLSGKCSMDLTSRWPIT